MVIKKESKKKQKDFQNSGIEPGNWAVMVKGERLTDCAIR